jgi:NADP-dependent 3-hydroxy acid dehydrogenase YdfG
MKSQPQGIVVGASSEIGTAVAVVLADLGLSPVLVGRNEQGLTEAASRCATALRPEQDVSTCVLDVTDHESMTGMIRELGARGPVSAAVWVAGVFDWAPAHEADPSRWAGVIDTNLTAAAVFTTAVAPLLVAAAPSSLVHIGSGAAHQAFPGNAAYVASKHGLAGLSAATFLDLRDHGVKVSLVSPGLVAAGAGLLSPTGATAPERLLSAEDVAAAVRFVVTFPRRGCPTLIRLEPQSTP